MPVKRPNVILFASLLMALAAFLSFVVINASADDSNPNGIEEQAEWHDNFLGQGIFGSTPVSVEVFDFVKEQIPQAQSGNPNQIISFMTGHNPLNNPVVTWGNAKGFEQYKWDVAYMSREAPSSACGIWYDNHINNQTTTWQIKQSCEGNISYIYEEEALLNLTVDMLLESWTASKPLSPNITWNSTASEWQWVKDNHRWALHQMVFKMNEMGCAEFNSIYPDINSKLLEVMNDHSINQEFPSNHYLAGQKQHFGITC